MIMDPRKCAPSSHNPCPEWLEQKAMGEDPCFNFQQDSDSRKHLHRKNRSRQYSTPIWNCWVWKARIRGKWNNHGTRNASKALVLQWIISFKIWAVKKILNLETTQPTCLYFKKNRNTQKIVPPHSVDICITIRQTSISVHIFCGFS